MNTIIEKTESAQLKSNQILENTFKIDMEDFIYRKYQHGVAVEGVLHIDDDDLALFEINSERLSMKYFHKTIEFRDFVEQVIPIAWTRRNFVYTKPRFCCPECGKMVNSLYYSEIFFVCQKCAKSASKHERKDITKLMTSVKKLLSV